MGHLLTFLYILRNIFSQKIDNETVNTTHKYGNKGQYYIYVGDILHISQNKGKILIK